MDHVDVSRTRDLGSASSLTTLHVFIPYSNANSGNNSNNNSSNIVNNTSATVSLSSSPHAHPTTTTTAGGLGSSISSSNGNGGENCSNVYPLAKPTLDPSLIRFCPEECWVPDAQVMTCMAHECNVSFSLFNRKHHCRVCGRVFCAACCSHIITLRSTCEDPLSRRSFSWTEGVDTAASVAAPMTTAPASDSNSFMGRKSSMPTSVRLCSTQVSLPQQQASYGSFSFVTTAPTPPTTHRICSACYYEMQLVVPRRNHNGEMRRRCRGELKMCQWSLLVKMLSYLSIRDLLEASLVSSDFYFISRDNVIWYQYNMAKRQEEENQLKIPMRKQSSSSSLRKRFLQRPKSSSSELLRTALGDVTLSNASKRVISLHARYNFTQFLDYTRRQEMARCRVLSSFSVGACTLLSSPLNVAIIGPPGVGKGRLLKSFIGLHDDNCGGVSSPMLGFMRHEKAVRLTGSLTADVMLHIYVVSGEPRFEELRRFLCSNCHAIGLCYDPRRKVTLVEAADIMMGVEPALGPQPVIVCGVTCPGNSEDACMTTPAGSQEPEVTEAHASGITVRGRGSMQCAWNKSKLLFQQIVQSVLDCLAMATTTSMGASAAPGNVRSVSDERENKANRCAAQELLRISLDPSPLDVLMDNK